jgi:hypothetical protein
MKSIFAGAKVAVEGLTARSSIMPILIVAF